jgi:hypothetical protein
METRMEEQDKENSLSRLIEHIWAEVPAHGAIVVDCDAQIGEEEIFTAARDLPVSL